MIETPVKPAPPSAAVPPPDPRTRVMDPPPDPSSRYHFACRECGRPLHEDQAACLACGSMVESGDGRLSLRRAVASSAAILLLLGGAVGAAIAGLPNGKHVSKGTIAQVFGTKPSELPPATVTPTPRSGGTASLPSSGSTAKAPAASSHKAATPTAAPSRSTTPTSSGGSSSGATHSATKAKPKKHPEGAGRKHRGHATDAPPTRFPTRDQLSDARVLTGSPRAGDALNVIDDDVSTAWRGAKGAGIWVQPQNPGPFVALGVLSKTPGYTATVYYTTSNSPPPDLTGGWQRAGVIRNAGKKKRFALQGFGARHAKYYLVVINSSSKVNINEIELLL